MDRAAINELRAFNRVVTESLGVLNHEYLARARPLGASRVLWEVGTGVSDVRELRSTLGLDSGYVSRLLRSLELENLIVVRPSVEDSRVRTVGLTPEGRREYQLLDAASDALAESLLAPLSWEQRELLVEAVMTVRRLLTVGMIRIGVVDPRSRTARHCLHAYFAELDRRFDTGFDPEASISADADELTMPAGVLLVARLRGQPVACGALKLHGGAPAEIKRMWVDPAMRGHGLGRRMLTELEHHAAANGATTLRLETNETLTEAISLYRSAGYRDTAAFNDEPFAHHWFEKHLRPNCG